MGAVGRERRVAAAKLRVRELGRMGEGRVCVDVVVTEAPTYVERWGNRDARAVRCGGAEKKGAKVGKSFDLWLLCSREGKRRGEHDNDDKTCVCCNAVRRERTE